MSKPLVVTVPHRYSRDEAKARIAGGLGQVKGQLAGFVSAIDERWEGDRMDFRLTAVGQAVSGVIEVLDDAVRIEVVLPGFLGVLAGKIGGRIRQQAALLLEKK